MARWARPIVARLYDLKRRYRIGDGFLARHPKLTETLMSLLGPVKERRVVDVHGHVLEVDENDFLGLTVTKIYEPDVTRFLQAHVGSGALAVDLGANVGYFTLLFAQLVGETGRVIAFEPEAANFRLLEQNVRTNGYSNIETHQKAVSDHCGRGVLHVSPVNPGDHRLIAGDDREAVPADVVALDRAMPELRGKLDWLKIDVQGAELAALSGMRSLIESSANLSIVLEFAPQALREFGSEPEELLQFLIQRGFDAYSPQWDGSPRRCSVDDLARHADSAEETYTNLIFSRRGFKAGATANQSSER